MSLHVTPGRIVIVRLAHGWRHAAVVMVGCSDWQQGHPIACHVFDRNEPDLESLLPDLAGEWAEKRADIANKLLNTGARVHRAQGFVLVDLPEVDPNDELAVGWFFPPREGSR